MKTEVVSTPSETPRAIEAHFLGILPRIETHARSQFRQLSTDLREEYTAEVTALCWAWFVELYRGGKNPVTFVSALADYAVRRVRAGRTLCGGTRERDAMNHLEPRDKPFHAKSSSPDVVAQVHHDLKILLKVLPSRTAEFCRYATTGVRNNRIATVLGVTNARVSQMRAEAYATWRWLCTPVADRAV